MLQIEFTEVDNAIKYAIDETLRLFFGELFCQETYQIKLDEGYNHKLVLKKESLANDFNSLNFFAIDKIEKQDNRPKEKNQESIENKCDEVYCWSFIKDENSPNLPANFTLNTQSSYNLYLEIFKVCILKEKKVSNERIRIYQNSFKIKRDIKRMLYQALAKITNVSFPWGSLTGIRPTLIARECMLLENEDAMTWQKESFLNVNALAYQLLQKYFLLDEAKIRLVLKTAYEEVNLAKKIEENTSSIYVSIPFCPSRCSYCTFSPLDGIKRPDTERALYVKLLIEHINEILSVYRPKLNSLYIGGGTPSTLSADELDELLACLRYYYPQETSLEWTFEAGRPDTLSYEKLAVAKKWGVSRICINPQTFHNQTLKRINRKHSVEDIYKVYSMARSLEFADINMDLIIGLPGENTEMYEYSLQEIARLKPDSFTVHALSLKKKSLITQEKKQGLRIEISDLHRPSQNLNDFLQKVEQTAENIGLVPYYMYRQKQGVGGLENIGYAKPDRGSLYNVAMMGDLCSILGIGVGAMSKKKSGSKIERLASIKSVQEFLKNISQQTSKKIEFFGDLK